MLQKSIRTLLMGSILSGVSLTAIADDGPYIGLEAGASFVKDRTLNVSAPLLDAEDRKKTGPNIAALVGYAADKWRVEASARFRYADYDSVQLSNATIGGNNVLNAGGKLNSKAFGISAHYNLFQIEDWRFFIGAGVDMIHLKVKDLAVDLELPSILNG